MSTSPGLAPTSPGPTLITPAMDYTRVSDDAAILCRRQDFPRAVNVLQRRAPDHRRWRFALQRVAASSSHALVGPRRTWVAAALSELLHGVPNVWLRRELAVDLRAHADGDLQPRGILPAWSARDLWRIADEEGVPMGYIARVTALPRGITMAIDTAQVVLDARRTALAHRDTSFELVSALRPVEFCNDEASEALRTQVDAHRHAAERWRALAKRLLGEPRAASAS